MRLIDADTLAARYMGTPPDYYHTTQIVGEITAAPTVKLTGWISVEDFLPDAEQTVLVALYGHDVIVAHEGESLDDAMERVSQIKRVTTGFMGENGRWWLNDGFPMIVCPKFWMPLPEPPEVKHED